MKGNIGDLVENYGLNQGLEFVATDSFSEAKEAVASAQGMNPTVWVQGNQSQS